MTDDYDEWTVAQLKREMSYCKVKANKLKPSKQDTEDILLADDACHDAVSCVLEAQWGSATNTSNAQGSTTACTSHCFALLCNVLFSDEFHSCFARLDNALTHADVDSAIIPQDIFWSDVREAYVNSDSDEIGELIDVEPHLSCLLL